MDSTRASWRKSSFSGVNSDCVEVSWRKSSFSDQNSNCVEVAHVADRVGLRDSKNTTGPVLVVPAAHWKTLLTTL